MYVTQSRFLKFVCSQSTAKTLDAFSTNLHPMMHLVSLSEPIVIGYSTMHIFLVFVEKLIFRRAQIPGVLLEALVVFIG